MKFLTFILILGCALAEFNVDLEIVDHVLTDSTEISGLDVHLIRNGVVVQKIKFDSRFNNGGTFVRERLNKNDFVLRRMGDGAQIKYTQVEKEFGIFRITRFVPRGTRVTDCFNMSEFLM